MINGIKKRVILPTLKMRLKQAYGFILINYKSKHCFLCYKYVS